jgi:hypothetical protein
VQKNASHQVSLTRVSKATGQTIDDIADILQLPPETVKKMEKILNGTHKSKTSFCAFENFER